MGTGERTIFAGGGRGIALARSEKEAHTGVHALVSRFREITHGGVMAACAVPLNRGGDGEAQSLRWLRHRLDLEKDAAWPPGGVLPDRKEAECAYCRSYRGTRPRTRDDQVELVCARCDAMLARGRAAGPQPGHRFGEMSQSIADIAEGDRIAVISADGNSLGVLFEGLRSLVDLAAVSAAVAALFARAHEAALACVAEGQRVPLMTGGDDVRAFIPPSATLAYITALVEAVESGATDHARALRDAISPETAERLGELGVGIGAVIAHVTYPAWRLVDHAHALERSAKAGCHAHGWRSGLDFAIVTTEGSMTAEPGRTREPGDIRPLAPRTAAWRDALRNAEALANIPSAQLGVLAAGHALDPAELRNLLCYQVARSEHWRAWYAACGVDWRDPAAVFAHRPDRGSLELAGLLAWKEASA